MVTELKKHFLTEDVLRDLLGVDQKTFDRMIEKGLPYIKLGRASRIFFEPSVVGWLKGQETGKKENRIVPE